MKVQSEKALDYFIAGVNDMAPRMIEIECPDCHRSAGSVSAGMGGKTIKCKICGKYIHLAFCENRIKITDRP